MGEAYHIATTKTKSLPSKQAVENISETWAWKIDSLGCHPVRTETINISTDKNSREQLHQIRWKFGDESVNDSIFLWAVAKYVTNVHISLEVPEEIERYFVANEIDSLVQYCNA